MRILVVNPVPPSTPHISAVRAWRFACALADFGHELTYLTGQAPDGALPVVHPGVRQISPVAYRSVATARGPVPSRRLATMLAMLRHGGGGRAWKQAAIAAIDALPVTQRPEVVWATFGRLEAAVAARTIARRAHAPWVFDIKDNPEIFIPRRLWGPMARRLSGWSALTANAQLTRERAMQWLGGGARVVYSGVDAAFSNDAGRSVDPGRFRIQLIGSLYDAAALRSVLSAIEAFASALPPAERAQVRLAYLGADRAMFDDAAATSPLSVAASSTGYLGVAALADACTSAAVNAYVIHGRGFHHKLLELLACRRPVLTFGRELEEGRQLARETGGTLLEAEGADTFSAHLRHLHGRWRAGEPDAAHVDVARYTWPAQARALEEVLSDVVHA